MTPVLELENTTLGARQHFNNSICAVGTFASTLTLDSQTINFKLSTDVSFDFKFDML